jgi:hypothetical protein
VPGLPDAAIDLVASRALALAAAGVEDDDAVRALRALSNGDYVLLRLARARCGVGRRAPTAASAARARALIAAAAAPEPGDEPR